METSDRDSLPAKAAATASVSQDKWQPALEIETARGEARTKRDRMAAAALDEQPTIRFCHGATMSRRIDLNLPSELRRRIVERLQGMPGIASISLQVGPRSARG
jgi:hypothetical protein